MTLSSIPVYFKNHQGQTLSGRLETCDRPKAYAIYAHCFTCTKNITAAHVISKSLAEHGIATLRFDFMGLGESEGNFCDSSLSSNIGDILSAHDFLTQNYEPTSLLVGHSLGGLASLYAGKKMDNLKGCVTLNAPSTTKHTRQRVVEQNKETIIQQGYATLDILGKLYKVHPDFDDDLKKYETLNLDDLTIPLLVMQATEDSIVPLHHGHHIFEKAGSLKSFIALDGMDHLFKSRENGKYVADIIYAWIKRYTQSDLKFAN